MNLWDLMNRGAGAAQAAPIVKSTGDAASGKSLFDEAVLLSLELRSFGTSRKLGDEEYKADAAKEKTRASKGILQSAELKAIRQYDAITRKLVSMYTLPSQFRAGLYVLPLKALEKVDSILIDRIDGRNALVDAFCRKYPDLKWSDSLPADQGGLGSCYHEKDYPDVERVRESFEMKYSYTEFTAPGKLKAFSKALYDRESEKARETWKNAIEEGQALLRGAFAALVEHMRERLSGLEDGKPKKFKDTIVSNVLAYLDTFDARNIAGDAELQSLVKQMADTLQGVTPADLRKSDTVRARVAATTETIKTALDTMIVNKPGRKIDLQSDEWGDL